MDVKKILVPTDYTECSEKGLDVATALAHVTGASLLIVHVSELEPLPVGELFDEDPRPDPGELARLGSVRPTDDGVCCHHRLLFGKPGSVEPAEVIARAAHDEGVDMIVLGTHGRTGLGHLLTGSVAESLVRHAPCPVITVRQPEEQQP